MLVDKDRARPWGSRLTIRSRSSIRTVHRPYGRPVLMDESMILINKRGPYQRARSLFITHETSTSAVLIHVRAAIFDKRSPYAWVKSLFVIHETSTSAVLIDEQGPYRRERSYHARQHVFRKLVYVLMSRLGKKKNKVNNWISVYERLLFRQC